MNKTINIGIYDSGLGGLTVLKEFRRMMPQYNYIYFGDTAHVPYGNKSKQNILNYSKTAIQFFKNKDVSLIVIACNTVSSLVLQELKKYTDIPLVDVITPFQSFFQQPLKHCEQNICVGVIGTSNTIHSRAYNELLNKVSPKIQVYSKACPMFVPIIELGFVHHRISKIIIAEYLDELLKQNLNYLILACTHYPILKKQILKYIPNNIEVIDSASTTAIFTQQLFKKSQMFSTSTSESICEIYVSDEPSQFQRSAKLYFNFEIDNVNLI